jgi:thioredoxin reductase
MNHESTGPAGGPSRDQEQYDAAVVGGGAAGLSAALMLGRALRRVAVIDAGQPRNAPADRMHAFLGHDGLPPSELLEKGRQEILNYGVDVVRDRVVNIQRDSESHGMSFTVSLNAGSPVSARRILIAAGARDELPDIPGITNVWGRDVHICPYCHGYEVRNTALGVIATGDHSVTYALLIRNWTPDLVFFEHERGPSSSEEIQRLDAMGIRRVAGRVTRLVVEGGRLAALELESGVRVERSAVFLGSHLVPHLSFARSLELSIKETPQGSVIDVDPQGRTSVPGVWAAGNVANPSLQVVGAAAAGNVAGGAINMDLIMEDVERRVAEAREQQTQVVVAP